MGFIYLAGCADGSGPVKIGFSASPLDRLATLQSGSPVELKILATARGSYRDERQLHTKYQAHRLHGEWFLLDAVQLASLRADLEMIQNQTADDMHQYGGDTPQVIEVDTQRCDIEASRSQPPDSGYRPVLPPVAQRSILPRPVVLPPTTPPVQLSALPVVMLPPLKADVGAAWAVVYAISAAGLDSWTLVGGQMVMLHLLERKGTASKLIITDDADVVVDMRARPGVLGQLISVVEDAGLEPLVSPSGVLHRWRSASGIVVDIMVSEGLRTPPKMYNCDMMMVPGGTQALRRSVPVLVVSADGTSGVVRRPSILGSILMKADAWRNDHTPERERHLRDIALLFNAVTDSELDGMRTELAGKERRRLADTPLMAGSDAEQWRPLGPTSADAYRRYAYLCAS